MSVKVFWLEPTDQTRERVIDCGCGAPDCSIQGSIAHEVLYRRSDTGELVTIRDAPIGAMWDATWYDDDPAYTGPDGITLVVRTPGGTWCVDSEASNCTRKGDLSHKCWIREGDPRQPATLHVSKGSDPSKTCSAGAGSIQCGSYHGFLHHGELT